MGTREENKLSDYQSQKDDIKEARRRIEDSIKARKEEVKKVQLVELSHHTESVTESSIVTGYIAQLKHSVL